MLLKISSGVKNMIEITRQNLRQFISLLKENEHLHTALTL